MIRNNTSLLLASVSVAAVSFGVPAFAQQRHFEIQAQPANTGIQEFGRQAGVQIMAPSEALANISTRRVSGDLEVRAGLDQLLKDTGLQAISSDGKRFVVRKAVQQASAAQPTNREAALSPVVLQFSSPPAGAISAEPAATLDIGEVVVTASRIQSAGFTAPTPTTVLGTTELTRRAPATIQESLNEVPSFRPSVTAQQNSASGGTNANSGAALVDLRGLGSARTLLLINGRRTGGSQDLNQFPINLAQRVDVVTGGASAAYGSDAVAGVVNIILDTKFNGLKGEAQYGQSKYGDAKSFRASLAAGTDLFGGRGHVLLGGEYNDYGGATTEDKRRPWIAANRMLQITNPCPINVNPLPAPCAGVTNGLPPFIQADDQNFSTIAPGGIITAGPLKGITFEDGGVPRQFRYGIVLGQYMLGGEQSDPTIFYINSEMKRYSAFSRFDFKVTDNINFWSEVSHARNVSRTLNPRPRDQGNITIRLENPFIPAVIRTQMVGLGLTSLTMGRINNDGGQPQTTNTNTIYRYAAGLDGTLGGGWTWDAYIQRGVAHQLALTRGSRNQARWTQALDVVNNAQGIPICRNAAGGCVPFNIFGPNAASQGAREFVYGVQTADTDRSQSVAAFNLRGEPLSTWAGPVAMAVGAEYRKERQDTYGDPIALARGWDAGNTQALTGSFNVKEAYAEVAVPLAKGMTFARSIDLNGAVRRTRYSTGGGYAVTTWKVGAVWEPTSELLLRGTVSRDIRAPSISELFNPGSVANQNAINFRGPFAGQGIIVPLTTSGNPNLRPERANTLTAGFSYRPTWARLRFSADYYRINVRDQIGTIGSTAVVDRCRLGDQAFCNLVTFNAVGTITAVNNPTVNSNNFITRGIDLEASFTQPLGEIWSGLPGTLAARALATRYLEYALVDAVLGRVDRSGQNQASIINTTSVPSWLTNYTVSYELDRFTGSVQFRYISPGVLERTSITGTDTERLNNKVGSQTVVNFAAQYNIITGDRKLQLFGAINNAFNKGPPFPIWPLSNLGVYYDSIGTVYRAGVRFTY